MNSKYATVRQTAEHLGVAEITVRTWLAKRLLEKAKFGRAVRIPQTDIARFIEQGTVPSVRRLN